MTILRSLITTLPLALLMTTGISHGTNHVCTGESFAKIVCLFESVEAKIMETQIKVADCDPEIARSKQALEKLLRAICKQLGTKSVDAATIAHIGDDRQKAGYSACQLIDRGSINAHVANSNNGLYLTIATFQPHNPYDITQLAKTMFKGSSANLNVTLRQ